MEPIENYGGGYKEERRTNKHTDRQAETTRGRESCTDRQTDRLTEKDRQTDRQTGRQRARGP